MNPKVEFLQKHFGWYEGLAQALVDAEGDCQYCGENLLETRLGYSSIVMDHLLPKSLYPELEWDIRNHVLSCSSCNSIKGNWDPLLTGEDASEMLTHQRSKIIDRVRKELSDKINARENEWKTIRREIVS